MQPWNVHHDQRWAWRLQTREEIELHGANYLIDHPMSEASERQGAHRFKPQLPLILLAVAVLVAAIVALTRRDDSQSDSPSSSAPAPVIGDKPQPTQPALPTGHPAV